MNSKSFKISLSILIGLFVIAGCKKSSSPKPQDVDLSGVFSIDNMINLAPVVMYTANGEVTDGNVINDFVKRRINTAFFTFNQVAVQSYFPKNEITFANDGKATWSGTLTTNNIIAFLGEYYYPYTPPLEYNVIQRSSTGFILEAIDSTKNFPATDFSYDRAGMLLTHSNTLKLFSNCSPVICVTQHCYTNCGLKNAYPFIIKNGKVYLQLYNCFVSSSRSGSYYADGGADMIGSFNTDVTNQLAAGDTIVYQNKTILFNKN